MSRTHKDLKSYKKGFGELGHKPKRKLTPFIHDANKVVGKNEVLGPKPNTDISQDDFNQIGGHWFGAKSVRNIRKQKRREIKDEKSRARTKIKQHDKNLNYGNGR